MISASVCLSSQPDTAVQTAEELPLHHVVGHHHARGRLPALGGIDLDLNPIQLIRMTHISNRGVVVLASEVEHCSGAMHIGMSYRTISGIGRHSCSSGIPHRATAPAPRSYGHAMVC